MPVISRRAQRTTERAKTLTATFHWPWSKPKKALVIIVDMIILMILRVLAFFLLIREVILTRSL